MTPEEQITKMKKAINQAMKVMGDRFGSTEADVEKAIDELKASMQTTPVAVPQPLQSQSSRDRWGIVVASQMEQHNHGHKDGATGIRAS